MAEAMDVSEEKKRSIWDRWRSEPVRNAKLKHARSLDEEDETDESQPRKGRRTFMYLSACILSQADVLSHEAKLPERYRIKAHWGGIISTLYASLLTEEVIDWDRPIETILPAEVGSAWTAPSTMSLGLLFAKLHALESTTSLRQVVELMSEQGTPYTLPRLEEVPRTATGSGGVEFDDAEAQGAGQGWDDEDADDEDVIMTDAAAAVPVAPVAPRPWVPQPILTHKRILPHQTQIWCWFSSREIDYLNSSLLYGLALFAEANKGALSAPQGPLYFNEWLWSLGLLGEPPSRERDQDALNGRHPALNDMFVDSFDTDGPRMARLSPLAGAANPFGYDPKTTPPPRFDRPVSQDSLLLFPVLEFLLDRDQIQREAVGLLRMSLRIPDWPCAFLRQLAPWLVRRYPQVYTRLEIVKACQHMFFGPVTFKPIHFYQDIASHLPDDRGLETNRNTNRFFLAVTTQCRDDWFATMLELMDLIRLPQPKRPIPLGLHRQRAQDLSPEDQAAKALCHEAYALLELLLQFMSKLKGAFVPWTDQAVHRCNIRPYALRILRAFNTFPRYDELLRRVLGLDRQALHLFSPSGSKEQICPCLVCQVILYVLRPCYTQVSQPQPHWVWAFASMEEVDRTMVYLRDTLDCDIMHHDGIPLSLAAMVQSFPVMLYLYEKARHLLHMEGDIMLGSFFRRPTDRSRLTMYPENMLVRDMGTFLAYADGAQGLDGQSLPYRYTTDQFRTLYLRLPESVRIPEPVFQLMVDMYKVRSDGSGFLDHAPAPLE